MRIRNLKFFHIMYQSHLIIARQFEPSVVVEILSRFGHGSDKINTGDAIDAEHQDARRSLIALGVGLGRHS